MKVINAKVVDQTLSCNKIFTVNGTVNIISVEFEFDDYWLNSFPTKRALFENSKSKVKRGSDIINGVCKVPHEVLKDKGYIYMSVEGMNTSPKTERTNKELVSIQERTITETDNTIEPTPDQYAQFIEAVQANADRAEAAKEEVERMMNLPLYPRG